MMLVLQMYALNLPNSIRVIFITVQNGKSQHNFMQRQLNQDWQWIASFLLQYFACNNQVEKKKIGFTPSFGFEGMKVCSCNFALILSRENGA